MNSRKSKQILLTLGLLLALGMNTSWNPLLNKRDSAQLSSDSDECPKETDCKEDGSRERPPPAPPAPQRAAPAPQTKTTPPPAPPAPQRAAPAPTVRGRSTPPPKTTKQNVEPVPSTVFEKYRPDRYSDFVIFGDQDPAKNDQTTAQTLQAAAPAAPPPPPAATVSPTVCTGKADGELLSSKPVVDDKGNTIGGLVGFCRTNGPIEVFRVNLPPDKLEGGFWGKNEKGELCTSLQCNHSRMLPFSTIDLTTDKDPVQTIADLAKKMYEEAQAKVKANPPPEPPKAPELESCSGSAIELAECVTNNLKLAKDHRELITNALGKVSEIGRRSAIREALAGKKSKLVGLNADAALKKLANALRAANSRSKSSKNADAAETIGKAAEALQEALDSFATGEGLERSESIRKAKGLVADAELVQKKQEHLAELEEARNEAKLKARELRDRLVDARRCLHTANSLRNYRNRDDFDDTLSCSNDVETVLEEMNDFRRSSMQEARELVAGMNADMADTLADVRRYGDPAGVAQSTMADLRRASDLGRSYLNLGGPYDSLVSGLDGRGGSGRLAMAGRGGFRTPLRPGINPNLISNVGMRSYNPGGYYATTPNSGMYMNPNRAYNRNALFNQGLVRNCGRMACY